MTTQAQREAIIAMQSAYIRELFSAHEAAAYRRGWETAREAAETYLRDTLAGNHPHLAEAYRHAAANIGPGMDHYAYTRRALEPESGGAE